MKTHLKKLIAIVTALVVLSSVCVVSTISPNAAGTGAGLAEWALTAYYEGWDYVWGGASRGAVDCSGLIYSYSPTGSRTEMVDTSQEWGYVSSGIPRVHGLGLHQPGHYGVYVGNGMAVDARGTDYGVCYESTSSKAWVEWFKVCGVSYPSTGWVKFNGEYFYYENGEYVVNTSRTIGGVTYSFSSSGASDQTPSDMSAVANGSGSSDSGNSGGSGKKKSSSSSSSSSSSGTSNPNVLKLGSSGDKVTKLQNRLAELGYYSGPVTGYFGELTEKAFKKFQKTAGLYVDGIAGTDLEILYSDSAPSAPAKTEKKAKKSEESEEVEEETEPEEEKTSWQLGDQGEKVVEIQNRLAELNYYNEESTGYFGDITENAVVAFQNASGLEPSGIADEDTVAALMADDAVENPLFAEDEEEETEEETEAEEANYEEYEAEEEEADDADEAEELSVYEVAEDNAENAQSIVVKTNKLSKKALAGAIKSDEKFVSVSPEEHNTNFLMWMLIVFALAAVVSGTMFVISRRNASYSGKRSKSRSERMTVRYW